MAENKIPFEVEVDGVEQSINSIKDLKAAIKAAKDEQVKASEAFGVGSKQYEIASKKVANLKDKVEDLNDTTKTLKGSGVEKITSSFSELGEGLTNLDTDKIKSGFRGLGAAMSAIPIFLLIEGLKYLVENFDEVSKAIRNFFNVASEAERNVRNLEAANKALKESNSLLISSLENEVKILEAQGSSQDKILAVKKQIIEQKIKEAELDVQIQKAKIVEILTNDSITESYYKMAAANARRLGQDKSALVFDKIVEKEKQERMKESVDALRTDLITINSLKTDSKVLDIKRENEITANHKKNIDERKAKDKEYFDLLKAEQARLADIENAAIDKEEARRKKEKADRAIHLEDLRQLKIAAANKENAEYEAQLIARAAAEKQYEDSKLAMTKQGLEAAQQLTDLYFLFKTKGLEKGSKEEEEQARKAFNINKALQIANATVTGFQSVQSTFATASASPITTVFPAYPFIQAGFAGVFSAANIAKIAAQQFKGGSSGGGSSAGSIGSAPIPAPPSINTNQNNTSTTFDESGVKTGSTKRESQTINITAQVVESEMTDKQKSIEKLKQQTTF